MADIKAQLKTKNGDNLYPVTSMAYVTATFNGGLSFNSSTNTLSTYRIPIASVSALSTSLGAKQAKCSAGFRTEINGATVAQARYFDITSTHSSGPLTLSAGCAYRIFATGNAVSLSAEEFGGAQFGLEGHATILVTNNSLLTFGSNVVLGQPLANDAVNNCTLRFHDGHCILDVEDHDAAHTVTVASGTGSGTLYYYCSAGNNISSETPQFISISDALDGGLVSFNGVSVNGEKHIAGNGTERTSLTSSFTPDGDFYITHAALSDMTAYSGGTVYLTDCAVPSGDYATFYSPLYIYDKLTVDGTLYVPGSMTPDDGVIISGSGTINLDDTNIRLPYNYSAYFSGCTISSGYATSGGAFLLSSGAYLELHGVELASNSVTGYAGAICGLNNTTVLLDNCYVHDNTNRTGVLYQAGGYSVMTISGSTIGDNQRVYAAGGSVVFVGSNVFTAILNGGGSCIISQGAVIDLTGNPNASPIAPGGGVTVSGGCTIINSAGSFVHIDDGSYSKINKDGTTA